MSNKLRKIFYPTKEEKIEQYEQYIKMCEDMPDCCLTCVWYRAPDPMLPGFIIDYGGCDKHPNKFKIREIGCLEYLRDHTFEAFLRDAIQKLKEGET